MRFRKSEYSALDAAIEAAQRFWAGILCNTRVSFSLELMVWIGAWSPRTAPMVKPYQFAHEPAPDHQIEYE